MCDIFEVWREWDAFPGNFEGDRGKKGVYAFRLKKPFNRLKGKTQIIYIGKSENKKGIFYRLMNYMQDNQGATQRLRDIEDFFGGRNAIQYSYVICENPAVTETELLHTYYDAHLELPPMNRNHRRRG